MRDSRAGCRVGPTSREVIMSSFRLVSRAAVCAVVILATCFYSRSVEATLPALSGSVVVHFAFQDTGDPQTSYWHFSSITNNLLLTLPTVIDLTAIGTGNWSDKNNWTQPTLDTS